MTVTNIHIVGSVPLADAETVFTTLAKALGPKLPRIPDGETGDPADDFAPDAHDASNLAAGTGRRQRAGVGRAH